MQSLKHRQPPADYIRSWEIKNIKLPFFSLKYMKRYKE